MLAIVTLEVPITGLVKINNDGHDFTETQLARANPFFAAIA